MRQSQEIGGREGEKLAQISESRPGRTSSKLGQVVTGGRTQTLDAIVLAGFIRFGCLGDSAV